MNQHINPQHIQESGKQLIRVSNQIVLYTVIIVIYLFVTMVLFVGESFDTLLIVNVLFGFSLLVVFVTLVLSIRNSGQLLVDSVNNDSTSSKIRNQDVTNSDGSFETYHPNGVLQTRGTKRNDKLHGEYEEYYPNGSIKVKGTYDDGNIVGKLKTYYDNGELKG